MEQPKREPEPSLPPAGEAPDQVSSENSSEALSTEDTDEVTEPVFASSEAATDAITRPKTIAEEVEVIAEMPKARMSTTRELIRERTRGTRGARWRAERRIARERTFRNSLRHDRLISPQSEEDTNTMPEAPAVEEQSSPFVGPFLRKIFYAYAKAFDEGKLELIPSRELRTNWPKRLQELKDLETQAAARMIELSYPK